MDEDNFELQIGQWHIVMTNGELVINGVSYERDNPDDATYDMVRELWRLKQ